MFRLQHTAMATVFEIRCASTDERLARQAASAAFDVVDRLEQELSRFIQNSDISRINHLSRAGRYQPSGRGRRIAHGRCGRALDGIHDQRGRGYCRVLPEIPGTGGLDPGGRVEALFCDAGSHSRVTSAATR
jgi:hypothetical protein